MPHTYTVHAHSAAEPHAVFALLLRAGTWPLWSPLDRAELEGGGDPDAPAQVGDVRVFRTGPSVSREPVLELVPDRRFVYGNVGGLFRSYRAVIDLAPSPDGGTDVTWSATLEPKLPGTGRFWAWYLGRFVQRMADGLARYAAGRSTGAR
ncbi:SRPBCC family protein [Cryptosporangium japonicum]|uniref:SRPBCC family protein n=1 Tax=Cryptosporangium japonicum TaxID=80872 RepID=A0ABP3E5W9_9ACTN